ITIVFLYPSENSNNDINSKNYQETSTKKNDPKFQNDFGNMYANGTNVHQSYEEAIKWYEKSANQGYAEAQYNLGTMYQNAIGVEQDFKKAIKYYKQAAEQGHVEAKENLEAICEENPELCK
ncbi:tetratricopeptide repeat protein, partial [Aliarcobacter butzleri]